MNVRGVASTMPLRFKERGFSMAVIESTCASTVLGISILHLILAMVSIE